MEQQNSPDPQEKENSSLDELGFQNEKLENFSRLLKDQGSQGFERK